MAGRHVSTTLTGVLLDEHETLDLDELCRLTRLHTGVVVGMVEEGVLEPRGRSPQEWRFPASTLTRLQAALRLQDDLGLNLAGAALALELLDELRSLRSRAALLEAMLSGGEFEEW